MYYKLICYWYGHYFEPIRKYVHVTRVYLFITWPCWTNPGTYDDVELLVLPRHRNSSSRICQTLKLYIWVVLCHLVITWNIRTGHLQQSSSTIMLFTRRNVVLCLSMVLTAASLASVVQTTTTCTPSPDNRCESGWYDYDGACYKYFGELLPFTDADDHCRSLGARLVSIHSEEEKATVTCLIPPSKVRISLETRSVLS